MIKGLIFDLDGVIVDTAKYHYLAWKELADSLGLHFTKEDNERLKGVSRVRSWEIILEINGITMSEEQKHTYCTQKNNVYLQYINKLREDEILPGAKEFLLSARNDGYRIALGSASKNTMLILTRLKIKDLFDAIIDGTKVTKTKPNPEVFAKGAEEIGVPAEQCVVFEDAEAGIEAAHNAGMKAVGIGSRERLPKAELNIEGFAGLTPQSLLEKLES
ncbi:MAG TPA: beta-phosphoglucomutase [Candidatus Limiplasma sp.]|nr:beta-phosphoglucomutase [Candidatus Limiplasma sp.]